MKRKLFNTWMILTIMLLALGTTQITSVHANVTNPGPVTSEKSEEITLAELGLENSILMGPIDQVSIPFSLPLDWQPGSEARLSLDMAAHFSSILIGQEEPNLETVVAGYLTVSLNGYTLPPFAIQGPGERSLQFDFPADALKRSDPDTGKHELVIQWDSSATCSDLASSVLLYETSSLALPHTSQEIIPDLISFPAPFYIEDVIFPSGVTIAVPDKPSEAEMQAALSISAGLGRLSAGELRISLVPAGALQKNIHADDHLILVGQTGSFSILAEETLKSANEGDGFVQLLISPWHTGRVLLVVDGQSDQAVLMAAEAVSAGELVTTADKDLALIKAAERIPFIEELDVDQTLDELIHADMHINALGSSVHKIAFYLPPGSSISPEAYFNMVFNHSTLLDYLRSGIIIRINGVSIGSVRMSDASAEMNAVRMIIPPSAVHPGINELEIQADLSPRDMCQDPRLESLWFTVFAGSTLHLPAAVVPMPGDTSAVLGVYPQPFVHAALSDTTLVLSQTDPAGWQAAAHLVADLGLQSTVSMGNVQVRFAENFNAADIVGNTIIVGQLEKLPLISEMTDVLPAPFGADNLLTTESQSLISFQVSADGDYGFLETARHALNPSAAILVVLGSSESGLQGAEQALLSESGRKKLMDGNFAVIQGRKIIVEEISRVIPQAEMPAGEEGETPGEEQPDGTQPEPTTPLPEHDPLILPVWILSILVIIAFLVWEILILSRAQK